MRYVCILLLAILHIHYSSTAQSLPQKGLLWRITGNGLQQPSYLFGTMHLADKRLFNFDDSVYAAIQSTEGLAIELNPDELAAYLVNQMMEDKEEDKKLDDMFRKEELRRFRKALAKKFKKPAEDVTVKDIIREKNKWVNDYVKDGSMSTFVDAYLYTIARRQGKWVGGIEDVADQMGLKDDVIDQTDIEVLVADDNPGNQLEKMISSYIDQDLNAIDEMMNAYDSATIDALLVKRNGKMAMRMDSMARVRSMFFAVGAAHLPASTGVISLLRKRGFTVEPVVSTTKTHAEKYKYKEIPAAWQTTSDEHNLYTIETPGNPATVKIYGLLEMKFLIDILNPGGYCVMAIPANGDLHDPQTIVNRIAKNIFKKDNIKSKRKEKNGLSIWEFSEKSGDQFMRMQMMVKDQVVYVLWTFYKDPENVSKKDADRFFNSFTLKSTSNEGQNGSYFFTDSIAAFSLTTSAKLELNDKLLSADDVDASIDLKMWTAVDLKNANYYMVISKSTKPGYYFENDSSILESLYTNMSEQYTLSKKYDLWNGCKSLMMEGISLENKHLYGKIFSYVRGNKNTVFITLINKENNDAALANEMFRSLKLLPYKASSWRFHTDSNQQYSAWTPSALTGYESLYYTLLGDNRLQISYDTGSSTTYTLTVDTLSAYTFAASTSAFWKEKLKDEIEATDSVVYEKEQNLQGQISKEVLICFNKNASIYKRVKYILAGRTFFQLYTSGELSTVTSENTDRFFKEFKPLGNKLPFNLTERKMMVLLKDLKDEDSTTRYNAYEALNDYDFSAQNLSPLYHALLDNYQPVASWDQQHAIQQRIAYALAKTPSPDSTIRFIRENYKELDSGKSYIKQLLVTILSDIKTLESYTLIADIAKTDTLSITDLPYSMRDSLPLVHQVFPLLLPQSQNDLLAADIAVIAIQLLDSSYIKIDDIKPSEADFIRACQKMIAKAKIADGNDYYNAEPIMTLLAKLNTNTSLNTISEFLSVPENDTRKQAVLLLLEHNRPVDNTILLSLASDSTIRISLYNQMKQLGKKNLFPQKFLNQKDFATSMLYDLMVNDEEIADTIAYKGIKYNSYQHKNRKFYTYKLTYGTDSSRTSYLGVSGAFESRDNGIEPFQDISGIYWDEPYESELEDYLLQKYIAEIEKGQEGSED
jgi:uncharacterized protein YbaP (TraB family)